MGAEPRRDFIKLSCAEGLRFSTRFNPALSELEITLIKENEMGDYYGYKVREQLYGGEDEYFRNNPHVSGMAAEDGNIIFNPYSKGVNFDSVGKNEAARLWMRENKVEPKFNLTEAQKAAFRGTEYENDEAALKHSIMARIISGDPSAGQVTPMQQTWSDWLLKNLNNRKR